MSQTDPDVRAAGLLLRQGLGPMTLIETIEEKRVSDAEVYTPEPEGTDQSPEWTYPPVKPNPHNHRFTITVGGPSIVVRAETGAELIEALRDLELSGAYQAIAYATQQAAAHKPQPAAPAPAPAPAPQQWAPQPQVQGPPFGPNVSVPAAPGYQAPGPYGQAAPAAPQGGRGGTDTPPPGWYRISVPWNAKDAFKAYREQNKDAFSGKIKWQSGGNYFIAPDVAQYFQQYGPVPA